ncbi:hypothetical protein [Undibacterium luofuense]|uniref:Uncharacterized protein n=1 Tax=Undibacterium luofuense TaxID=2828733 RepID=A0A941I8Y4_9BURK|nr:hypothetical protein [Undibacterium luofuense]MBR7784225.1 hypothetical protein [Undibacterium luofuense]
MSCNANPVSSDISIIAELAQRLQNEGQPNLRLELAPEELPADINFPVGCQLVDGAIVFESFEVRNTLIAVAAFDRLSISSCIDSSALFGKAYELWRHEIGNNDKAAGRLLALASKSIDILAAGAALIRSGSNVFQILRLIEAALPYLTNLEPASIIDLINAKYEPTKRDMAAGVINGALEEWLEKNPTIAFRLHTKTLENLIESNSSLLSNAIVALSKSNYAAAVAMAKVDAQSDVLLQAESGTWTLGRLLLNDQAEPKILNAAVETVANLIESEQHDIRSQAIRAAVGAMHKLAAFDLILGNLAENGDQVVLCATATAIFLKNDEFHERGITKYWLRLLPALKPDFKGAIQELDYALSKLLSDPEYVSTVIALLNQWVANHGHQSEIGTNSAELFSDTLSKIITLEDVWRNLVTDWLLSDKKEHPNALAGILIKYSDIKIKNLRFDKGRLDELSTNDLMFLARRMLGYVHDRAQVTSLAISMLESNNADSRIYPLLRTLLVDEIGYDYPQSTATALLEAAEEMLSTDDRDFLRMLAKIINQATETLGSLPTISELQPSTKLRRLFSIARTKQMNDSFEEASKNSIFRKIATEIPIKAGMGTFSYYGSSYGPSMKLHSISHSVELPRREVFDPIGNSIRRLGFILAKRGES